MDNPDQDLYEDELILAVSKPAGMIVHPDDKGKTGTLANAVAAYYLRTGQHCTVRPIHRLDEGTSGIVLFSKCPFFSRSWIRLWHRSRSAERTWRWSAAS